MNWELIIDVVAGICLIGGSLMALSAGIGVLRFPDLLSRMHAATKPQVLGLLLVLLGAALQFHTFAAVGMIVLIALFQMMTAPVAAHMVARAAYRTGQIRADVLLSDELYSQYSDQGTLHSDAVEPAGVADSADASEDPGNDRR